MIPDIAKLGTSFQGALSYYLHDKRQAGEPVRLTAERVAWSETRNLATDDPARAGRLMAATAMDADRLKHEAGIRSTGRKSARVVYTYTLAWHPDEAPALSRADMVAAAEETLQILGAQDHQALIVCHTDRAHPHVHVILNRVSPLDGRMLATSNDRLKLSQWALAYREARGELQYCPERAENWKARRKDSEKTGKLKYRRAKSSRPDSMIEDLRLARDSGDPKAVQIALRLKSQVATLSAESRAMRDRHREEWDSMSARFASRKSELRALHARGRQDSRAQVHHRYRPHWQELGRRHWRERRRFQARERSRWGRFRNALGTLIRSRRFLGTGGLLTSAFLQAASPGARAHALERVQRAEVREMKINRNADMRRVQSDQKAGRDQLITQAREAYLAEREALIQRQAIDKAQMKAAWDQYRAERKCLFETSRHFAHLRQEAKASCDRDVVAAQARFAESVEAAAGRAPRRKRKRRRRAARAA